MKNAHKVTYIPTLCQNVVKPAHSRHCHITACAIEKEPCGRCLSEGTLQRCCVPSLGGIINQSAHNSGRESPVRPGNGTVRASLLS